MLSVTFEPSFLELNAIICRICRERDRDEHYPPDPMTWYNLAFAGVAAAALLTTRLYARRGGAGQAEGTEGGAAVLPGHVRYDSLDDSGKDEY